MADTGVYVFSKMAPDVRVLDARFTLGPYAFKTIEIPYSKLQGIVILKVRT